MIEVNCETDFVARTDDFQAFAATWPCRSRPTNPRYVRREEVPAELSKRSARSRQQAGGGQAGDVVDRIVDGRLDKYFADICLQEQPFIKDGDRTIRDLVQELIAKLGENIRIRRFARFELGAAEAG